MQPPAHSALCREGCQPRRPRRSLESLSGLVQRESRAPGAPAVASMSAEPLAGCAAFPLGRGQSGSDSKRHSPLTATVPSPPLPASRPPADSAGPFSLQALLLAARTGRDVFIAQNAAFKAQLWAWVLRRRSRKRGIESPGGGPSAKRRLPFVCTSAQVFKSYT